MQPDAVACDWGAGFSFAFGFRSMAVEVGAGGWALAGAAPSPVRDSSGFAAGATSRPAMS